MTKAQVKSRVKKLLERLSKVQDEIIMISEDMEELENDIDETISEIEPYDNYADLTDEQQERYDWLEEAKGALESFREEYLNIDLEDNMSELEDYSYEIIR